MKVSSLISFLPLTASVAVAAPNAASSPDVAQSQDGQSSVYKTDLFQGTRRKEDESSLNASQLTYTTENGKPYFQPMGAQRAGSTGPLLLQDSHLIDVLAKFNRERIPERIVHARGAGAHGVFEATTDYGSKFSAVDMFKKGTKTSMTMRFSTVGGGRGSADEARDPRGVAMKFRTKQGILDWVFSKQKDNLDTERHELTVDVTTDNTPVFFIRDPIKFPRFIHTQKTDPATNTRNWSTFWAWPAQNPEALLQFLRLFSDLGTPYGFRHMDVWSGHTYKLVKDDGSWVYARVYLSTDQGVKNFTGPEATKIAGEQDTWATQDLYDNIESGNFPSWTVGIATKTEAEAAAYRYDVLDLTKDWPDAEYHEVGKITLTQNPENYFAEIEQSHFSPSNIVPGWIPSNDPVLQSRLFAYNDAARHRIGTNYLDVPVNCPFASVANFDRDGHLAVHGNQGSRPNFPYAEDALKVISRPGTEIDGPLNATSTTHFEYQIKDIDYEQPRMFYEKTMSANDRQNLHSNIGGTLPMVKNQDVLDQLFEQFGKISKDLEAGVKKAYQDAKKAQ